MSVESNVKRLTNAVLDAYGTTGYLLTLEVGSIGNKVPVVASVSEYIWDEEETKILESNHFPCEDGSVIYYLDKDEQVDFLIKQIGDWAEKKAGEKE